MITYFLTEKPKEERVRLQMLDAQGKVLRELIRIPQEAGIHRVEWALRIRLGKEDYEETERRPAPYRNPLGPPVLPGTYRVRLIVGEFQMEQPLTVRVEPALEPYLLGMKAGYQFALETLEMIQKLNRASRAFNSVETQLQNLRQIARQQDIRFPETLTKTLEQHDKVLNELKGQIDNPNTRLAYARGPRLRGRLNSVYSAVSSNTAPSRAQVAYFNEVKAEFEALYAKLQDYLQNQVPALNELLKSHNLPIVLLGEPSP
ncbi:MAG: hypothetical protein C4337_10085 [Armatimonadota bacterium]